MHTPTSKICRIENIKKLWPHRFKFLFGLFATVGFIYLFQPLGTSMTVKKPNWAFWGYRDTDFRLNESEIRILFWTADWGDRYAVDVFTNGKCPYIIPSPDAASGAVFDIPCRLTYDRRYLEASNALVFHSWDLLNEEIPSERSADQIWIYDQGECPGYTKVNLRDYPNVFNWTMTYRRDSDLYDPYAHVIPLLDSNTTNSSIIIDPQLGKRPKLVAWIVSDGDSHSKRESFARELQKFIPVSIFGRCGEPCPSSSAQECYDHVAKTHKFYLSFENTLCVDYVTEKLFNALRSNLVPVVYGGTDSEEYDAIAPKGSYVDARNFKSAQHLAQYLIYLDQDEEEYMKYFEWKKISKVIPSQTWCNLCQKIFEHLHLAPESSSSPSSERKRKYKWYKDIWSWWNYKSYNPRLEEERSTINSRVRVTGESSKYELGEPACIPPIKELIGSEESSLDFEPGFLNVKDFAGRMRDKIIGCF